MSFIHYITFLFFFLPFSLEQAQIVSLSNSILDGKGNQYSSLGGGTVFYLKGSGFDPILSNNVVLINGTIAATPQSTTTAYLVVTSPAMPFEGDFSLSLIIPGTTVLCLCDCRLFYRYSYTPEFFLLSPVSASPGDTLIFTGLPKTSLASGVSFVIAGLICVTTDTPTNDRSLNQWGSYSFGCPVPDELPSDYYNISISSSPQGQAVNYPVFHINTKDNLAFNLICVPSIYSLNSNIGSPLGQRIEVTGVGFSMKPEVRLGSSVCEVISYTQTFLTCQLPVLESSQGLSVRGRGLRRALYLQGGKSLQNLEDLYWANNGSLTEYTHSLESSFEKTSTETGFFEVFQAFFRAPMTGNYTFYLFSDLYTEVYLSSRSNSSLPGDSSQIVTWNLTIPSIPAKMNVNVGISVFLNESELYNLHTFKILLGPTNYLRLAVDTPLGISSFRESIQVLRIIYHPIREQLVLKVYSWKMGSFRLIVEGKDPVTGATVYYRATSELDYNISESSMVDVLSNQLGWGQTNLKRYSLNKTGGILSGNATYTDIWGFMFEINMTIFRDNYQGTVYLPRISLVKFDTIPKTSIVQVVPPTPCLTGDFSLLVNGLAINNINTNKTTLLDVFSAVPGFNRYVTTDIYGSPIEDRSYLIKFSGVAAPFPPIEIISSNLQGGQPDLPPEISVQIVQEAGSAGYYHVIPDELLIQASNENLELSLSVNGILGKCPNENCYYSINDTNTPALLDYNLTDDGLSLLLDNYQNFVMDSTSVTVEMALSPCLALVFELPYINCSIPKNSDGTLILAGGSYKPLLHVRNIGYAVYGTNVLPTVVIFSITALNLMKGSIMGGQTLVVSGSGFPISIEGITVSIGMSIATVINVTNTNLVLRTRAKSDNDTITIWFKGVSDYCDNYMYDFDITPVVSGVEPQRTSPVQKGTIKISGLGFGDDSTKIRVFLDKDDNTTVYELAVVGLDANTGEITALLSGGRQGDYRVRVNVDQIGDSRSLNETANLFTYEFSIDDISPRSGSIMGGTVLTIMGTNFSPVMNQNQIYIGERVNAFCDVVFSNETVVQCVTRMCDSNEIGGMLSVYMTQRVQENAICSNDCNFTFSMDQTPEIQLTNEIIQAVQGDILTLNGAKLSSGDSGTTDAVIGFKNQNGELVAEITSTNLTDFSISFAVPSMPAGLFFVSINIPNKGYVSYSNFADLVINNTLSILSVRLLRNSDAVFPLFNTTLAKGGVLLQLLVNGLIPSDSIYIQNSGFCVSIASFTNGTIICQTRNLTKANTNYIIYLYRGSSIKITCDSCLFNISNLTSAQVQSTNISSIDYPSSNFSISLRGAAFNETSSLWVRLSSCNSALTLCSNSFDGSIIFRNSTLIIASFSDIPLGVYNIFVEFQDVGFAYFPTRSAQIIKVNFKYFSVSHVTTGLLAGQLLNLTSQDVLFSEADGQDYSVKVCGSQCKSVNSGDQMVSLLFSCEAPPYFSDFFNKNFPIYSEKVKKNTLLNEFIISSDNNNSALQANIRDGVSSTFYDSGADICYLSFDFGADFFVDLHKIVYTMNPRRAPNLFYDLKIQYSSDNIGFYDLFVLGPSNLHSGRNIYTVSNGEMSLSGGVRYIRLLSPSIKHSSRCQLSDISFFGIKNLRNTVISNSVGYCDVVIESLNETKFTLTNATNYRLDQTPSISSLSPGYGPSEGGTTVTIEGNRFGNSISEVIVSFVGAPCAVQEVTDSQITCLTGPRISSNVSELEVMINGNKAVLESNSASFVYCDLWSLESTWGGEAPPRRNDSVYIPAGQTILVDISVEGLYSVIIEGGSLIFMDADISFSMHYLVCLKGRIIIGTEEKPIFSKIVISFLGSSAEKQLPIYGSKVWALEGSLFEIHGRSRNFTKALLNKSAEVGDFSIILSELVDWEIGNEILITSDCSDESGSEILTIANITDALITFNSPLQFSHRIVEMPDISLKKGVIVSLLSRNVIFKGLIEEGSSGYGGHIMVSGENSLIRISDCEFVNMGQSKILNRYPLNIRNIADGSDSYIKQSSFHDCFARAISLENSHFLTISDNTAHNIKGSAFVLSSGLEQHNSFKNNLAVSVKSSKSLMNLDLYPSAYYISNPNNAFEDNVAINSDFSGFNFDLKSSSLLDPYICPVGIPLLKFERNAAYGNSYFGLYIYQYMPRTIPCGSVMNANKENQFIDNPGIKAQFIDFLGFRNGEGSLLAEYIGNVDFKGLILFDTLSVAAQISDCRYTFIDGARILDSIIVGSDLRTNVFGIITPRTDNFFMSNVTFLNFSTNSSAAIQTCSKCNYFTINGGKTTKFSNLSFVNVIQRVSLAGFRKEILWDLDGSLSGHIGGSMITGYMNHFAGISACGLADNQTFGLKTVVCNSSVKIRPLTFAKLQGSKTFNGLAIKVLLLSDLLFNVSAIANTSSVNSNFSSDTMKSVWTDTQSVYVFPFVTGFYYNVHWYHGNLDFTHLTVTKTAYWDQSDLPIILKFNTSDYKDDYSIKVLAPNSTVVHNSTSYSFPYSLTQNISLCSGDYSFSNVTLDLFLKISSCFDNFDSIDISSVRYPRPSAESNFSNGTNGSDTIIRSVRFWSNASLWPSGMIPLDNEDVYIPLGTTIYLDINTASLGTLTIDGSLIFYENELLSLGLTAQKIWVRRGSLVAGNKTHPFKNGIEITLTGNQYSDDLIIDSFIDSGNKILAVTGTISLVSDYPGLRNSVKLGSPATKGSNLIYLSQAVDWHRGDQIVLGPSEVDYNSSEVRQILDITPDGKSILLDSWLNEFHFGAYDDELECDDSGCLDIRSTVSLISRKIKIQGDQDDSWGCNILVYETSEAISGVKLSGKAYLDGVEIRYCGQSDTERASFDVKYVKNQAVTLVRSSLHSGYGWGINVLSSNKVTVSQSLIYDCQKYLIRISYSNWFEISGNVLLAARARNMPQSGYYDMVAGVYLENSIQNLIYSMKENIVQGSQGNGFVFPGSSCGDNTQAFNKNQANSIRYAAFLITGNYSQCLRLNRFAAYSSFIGVLTNFEAAGISLNSGLLAENRIGLYTSFIHEGIDNSIQYSNLKFFAVARPNCQSCYNDNPSQCSDQKALIVPIVTIKKINGFPLYGSSPLVLLDLKTDAAFTQKLLLVNCSFNNYKTDYAAEMLDYCSNNLIFSTKHAPDAMSTVYLSNTSSSNSQIESFFNFSEPDPNLIGTACGNFNCTGENNFILSDLTGDFINVSSQIIPSDFIIGTYQCFSGYSPAWRSSLCSDQAFGILQFENYGNDQRLRPIAPVNLSSAQIENNILNQWREWSYQDTIPMNRRLSRFHGIVELNVTNNISFAVSVPDTMRFKLESSRDQDFLLVRIVYERSDVIEVYKQGKLMTPIDNTVDLVVKYKECGSNFYDYTQNLISFIITGQQDCVLIIRTVSYVRVSLRMQTDFSSFYSSNSIATFIDKIAAFLGIDFSRLRIASVKSGSVIVDFRILEQKKIEPNSSIDNTNETAVLKAKNESFSQLWNEFAEIIQKLANNINSSFGLPWTVSNMEMQPMVSNPDNLSLPENINFTQLSDNNYTSINCSDNGSVIIMAVNPNHPPKDVWGLKMKTVLITSLVVSLTFLLVAITCCCIKTKEGNTIFRHILNKILSKKSKIHDLRSARIIQHAKKGQIVPETIDEKVFDIDEECQSDKHSERTIYPPSTAISPMKGSKSREPFIFRKEVNHGTLDSIN